MYERMMERKQGIKEKEKKEEGKTQSKGKGTKLNKRKKRGS
jgi:hypothetical protein